MRLVFALALAVALGTLLLSGCAAIGGGPDMSVGQLRAMAADKNATAVYSKIMGPWGTGVVVYINLDETKQNGTVTVGTDGTMTATTVNPVKVPVVAPASVALSLDTNGNCVRTVFDASGHPTGSATVDRARCQ